MALNIPKQIRAGDTLKFTDSIPDYSALDGWTLNYSLANKNDKIAITSSASGSDHAISVPYVTTAAWASGKYRYQAYVDDGTDRYTVESGNLEILNDLKGGFVDDRNHVEKTLDAIEAVLEGKASQDQLSMSINGRSLTRFNPSELLNWRDKYRAELVQIRQRERIAQGMGSGTKIKLRFR